MRINWIVCGAVVAAMTLAGCSAGTKHIDEEDLYGTWYAQNTGKYQTITFAEDGSYTTEDFLSDGTFQIAKDGTVKLVDKYRDVETLTPVEGESGGWELSYAAPYIPTQFTRDEVSREAYDRNDIDDLTETQIWYMAAVDQMLKGVPWVTSDGLSLKFTENAMQVGENEPVTYKFISAEGIDEGTYIFEFSNSDGTYRGTLTEEHIHDNIGHYTITLKLNGETALSASADCEMIMLTQP